MDIRARKNELIHWLEQLSDEATIERIRLLKETSEAQPDWWNQISEAERAAIDRGLDDARASRVVPNDTVVKLYERWLRA